MLLTNVKQKITYRMKLYIQIMNQPLVTTQTLGSYDVHVNVNGGGFTGQAGAIRHGIARALLTVDPDFRPAFKICRILNT